MDADASPAEADVWTSTSIESSRVRLDPMAEADVDVLFPVVDDPRLHAFVGGEPHTYQELERWIASIAPGRSPAGDEIWCNWVVRLRQGGAVVGTVQATIVADEASLAWVIGTAWQDRGYAKEAASAVATWLRAHGVALLRANIHPDHGASQAVARSFGLTPTDEREDGEVVWRSR